MTGPSAIGSENGNPTSIRFAPPRSSAASNARVVLRSGNPAAMNGIRAICPRSRSCANVCAIREASSLIARDDKGNKTCRANAALHRLMLPAFDGLENRGDDFHVGQAFFAGGVGLLVVANAGGEMIHLGGEVIHVWQVIHLAALAAARSLH